MRRPVSREVRYAPNELRTRSAIRRRLATKNHSIRKRARSDGRGKSGIHKKKLIGQLTVGINLGDRCSRYCVLDEAGAVIIESTLATTRKELRQVFGVDLPAGAYRVTAKLRAYANTTQNEFEVQYSQKAELTLVLNPIRDGFVLASQINGPELLSLLPEESGETLYPTARRLPHLWGSGRKTDE